MWFFFLKVIPPNLMRNYWIMKSVKQKFLEAVVKTNIQQRTSDSEFCICSKMIGE